MKRASWLTVASIGILAGGLCDVRRQTAARIKLDGGGRVSTLCS